MVLMELASRILGNAVDDSALDDVVIGGATADDRTEEKQRGSERSF